MNEKKRDQMIRDTFDQCLSGIDALPSQRQEILREAKRQTREQEPVRFRMYAIPAALVILLCFGILASGGRLGFISARDSVRTGNQSTVQPVETLLAAGTEQLPEIEEYSEFRDVNLFSNRKCIWANPELKKLADDVTMAEDPARGKGLTPYIHSWYYDGESLIVAIVNPATTRITEFDPEKMDRSRMRREEDFPDLEWSRCADPGLEGRWNESIQSGTPMGLAVYGWMVDPWMWNETPEEVSEKSNDLMATASTTTVQSETGHDYEIEFVRAGEPLRDRLRGADSVNVTFRVLPDIRYYWFDGRNLSVYYENYEIDSDGSLNDITDMKDDDRSLYLSVPVTLRPADRRWYSGEAVLKGQEIHIQGMVSKASVRIMLSPKEPQQTGSEIVFPEENWITFIVQDENGKRLFFEQYPSSDETDSPWSLHLPQTLPRDPETGTEDFPSSLRVYAETGPVSINPKDPARERVTDAWGQTFTLPVIGPDTEPLAILTPTEP